MFSWIREYRSIEQSYKDNECMAAFVSPLTPHVLKNHVKVHVQCSFTSIMELRNDKTFVTKAFDRQSNSPRRQPGQRPRSLPSHPRCSTSGVCTAQLHPLLLSPAVLSSRSLCLSPEGCRGASTLSRTLLCCRRMHTFSGN